MEALKNIASGSSKGNPLVQALLGKDASEEELKSLTQQADSLWKYLDELSESDPEGYKSFIQKQAANVKEDMEAKLDKRMEGKEPAMVIESRKADKVPAEPVSVHIWAAKDGFGLDPVDLDIKPSTTTSAGAKAKNPIEGLIIPIAECQPPKTSDQQARPAAAAGKVGPQQQQANKTVYSVACHRSTLASATVSGAGDAFALVIEAALQYVQAKYGVAVDRQTCSLLVSRDLFSEQQRERIEAHRQQTALATAVQGTAAADLPQGLLSQLVASSTSAPSTSSASGSGTGSSANKSVAAELLRQAAGKPSEAPPASKSGGPLIVDLGDAPSASSASAAGQPQAPPAADLADPRIEQVQGVAVREDGKQLFRVVMSLPSVSKAKELDIEVVAGTSLLVTLPDGSAKQAAIPSRIHEDSVAAKFDKASKQLTVTMEFQDV